MSNIEFEENVYNTPNHAYEKRKRPSYTSYLLTINTNKGEVTPGFGDVKSKFIGIMDAIFSDKMFLASISGGDIDKISKISVERQFEFSDPWLKMKNGTTRPQLEALHTHILLRYTHTTKIFLDVDTLRDVINRYMEYRVYLNSRLVSSADLYIKAYIDKNQLEPSPNNQIKPKKTKRLKK